MRVWRRLGIIAGTQTSQESRGATPLIPMSAGSTAITDVGNNKVVGAAIIIMVKARY